MWHSQFNTFTISTAGMLHLKLFETLTLCPLLNSDYKTTWLRAPTLGFGMFLGCFRLEIVSIILISFKLASVIISVYCCKVYLCILKGAY